MGKSEEERQSIVVQKHPCLYNKAIPPFHNKNEKKNAWEVVGKELNFGSGEYAKNAFRSLHTKYVRRKNTLKESKKSGTGSEKVKKAEKDIREYLFLSWLDNFAYERNSKCNLQHD